MRKIIYKNPIIAGIFLNMVYMFSGMYAIKYSMTPLLVVMAPILGGINRKIIDNGIDMNRKRKMIILISFVVAISCLLFYSRYIYKVRINEIINK
ncbi:hypothetical protein ACFLKB_09170 [Clostridium sp. FAM 1755]|uniref:Uncharacterized protein n=1 Tax=Clostridium sporogenes TaxID=1509 RepID=A0AAE4FKC5_CLOSG|nr:hypothetical protein [Clostridium sporogenes]MDS1003423.1 hypothetical protein [Clostridium sporogenes]